MSPTDVPRLHGAVVILSKRDAKFAMRLKTDEDRAFTVDNFGRFHNDE